MIACPLLAATTIDTLDPSVTPRLITTPQYKGRQDEQPHVRHTPKEEVLAAVNDDAFCRALTSGTSAEDIMIWMSHRRRRAVRTRSCTQNFPLSSKPCERQCQPLSNILLVASMGHNEVWNSHQGNGKGSRGW